MIWLSTVALLSIGWTARAQGAAEQKKQPAKKRNPASPLGLSLEQTRVTLPEGGEPVAGLLVTRAVGSTFEAGLQAGDVLIELNGKPVTTVTEFWDRAAAAEWRLQLRALRDGKKVSFTLNGAGGNALAR
jgi:serine protease Do